jgi:hypothetical protein
MTFPRTPSTLDIAAQVSADAKATAEYHKRPRDAARIAVHAAASLAAGKDKVLLQALATMMAADGDDVQDAALAFIDAACDCEMDHMMRAVEVPYWPRSASFHPDQKG